MQPYQQPPIIPPSYTPYEEALIAGFLLHARQGVLHALATLTSSAADTVPEWTGPLSVYYEVAEAYSRYLLWLDHYPVKKGEMWNG